MKFAIGCLIAALLVCAGCALLPEKQMVTTEPITLADGTVIPVNTPLYIGADGKATHIAHDPKTGAPNAILPEKDLGKLQEWADKAKAAGGVLPEPFGSIAKILLGAGGGALIAAAAASNKKARAKAKAELETKKPEPAVAT